ncbi:MAG: hypothetical protein A3J29_07960 [Acidobacteria bacterium RIFCSPLOWO2_12_FULL_67_14b]|nr:MAG: hypothetical protein A3J29_07960 [Acidobacteria bacterium RIFCSPLOWO2_12_FULL_67_14b]
MIRPLYCVCCGATRTLDTARPYAGAAQLTCFRCGGTLFATVPERAQARLPRESWVLTVADRRFLRSLQIAGGVAVSVVKGDAGGAGRVREGSR